SSTAAIPAHDIVVCCRFDVLEECVIGGHVAEADDEWDVDRKAIAKHDNLAHLAPGGIVRRPECMVIVAGNGPLAVQVAQSGEEVVAFLYINKGYHAWRSCSSNSRRVRQSCCRHRSNRWHIRANWRGGTRWDCARGRNGGRWRNGWREHTGA